MQRILAVAVGGNDEQDSNALTRDALNRKRPDMRPYVTGLVSGLQQLGRKGAQDYEIDYATCNPADLQKLIARAVKEQRPDAIFAMSTSAVKAAIAAARDIPIVFPSISDPVEDGVIQSCAAPGGNATGIRAMRRHTAHECIELFKATVPSLRTVCGLQKPAYGPATRAMQMLNEAAKRAQVQFVTAEVQSHQDIKNKLGSLSAGGTAGNPEMGILVLPDDLVLSASGEIAQLAQDRRLPTFFPVTDWVRPTLPSALAGYGIPQRTCGEAAAAYVHKVLQGVAPRDLPVKRAGGFEWAVSKTVADAIGVKIPQGALNAVDRVAA